jgi:large subunit ribosomal protein L3
MKAVKGILGRKLGVSAIFEEDGRIVPVTVVSVKKSAVLQVKTKDNDGYEAVQFGYDPVEGSGNKASDARSIKSLGSSFTFSKVYEIRDFYSDSVKAGDYFGAEVLEGVAKVKVTGISKGRGFAGAVKRYGFAIGPMAHGSKNHRRVGSIGAGTSPGKVWKGQKMPGHYGNKQITTSGVSVVKIDQENGLVFLKGAVPGSKNSFVKILG